MKKYKLGYTQGVYDMFHVGHLNLLSKAKEMCESLIVGVNSDDLVVRYKSKTPVIGQQDRLSIIKALKVVDDALIVETLDKLEINKKIKFDAIFIGDDWKGDVRWEKTKIELAKIGVDVVFIPYTKGVSSTILRAEKNNKVEDK